jgi:hypothetical protein
VACELAHAKDGNPDQAAELRVKLGQVDDTKRRAVERTNGRLNVTREHRQHRKAMTGVRTWVGLENAYTRFLRLGTGWSNLTNWLIKAKDLSYAVRPHQIPSRLPG